jgi:hypothetical protein
MMDEAQVKAVVEAVVSELKATSVKDMGGVMKAVRRKGGGIAEEVNKASKDSSLQAQGLECMRLGRPTSSPCLLLLCPQNPPACSCSSGRSKPSVQAAPTTRWCQRWSRPACLQRHRGERLQAAGRRNGWFTKARQTRQGQPSRRTQGVYSLCASLAHR